MPLTPDERRTTFDALAEKRQEMLRQERERQLERERSKVERTTRQKAASLTEQDAEARTGEAREEWRQEQHAKHEEALEAARKAEKERVRQEAKRAKEAEADVERIGRMRDIHERAVAQKTAARKVQAQHIEEETLGNIDDALQREIRDTERVLERTLEHLSQDRKKKLAGIDDVRVRETKALADAYAGPPKRVAEHKRALLALSERTEEGKMKIETEYARLHDEAVRHADEQKARLRANADRRIRDAKTRHENEEQWIDAHRGTK